MSQETASLVLKSGDLTVNASTTTGTANANKTQLTWNNINLRVLLGEMYDKFDRFNLCLNTIATCQADNALGTVADDRCTYITIAGLPWTNNTYNQKSNANTLETVIASCVWVANGQTTQYYYGNNVATFGKNQDICNITITLRKIVNDALPNSVPVFPNTIFVFDIMGVDEYRVKNITDSRMIK